MARFEHPLQLFTLDYPDDWEVRYQEETGGVAFIHPGTTDASALSLSPFAVSGGETALAHEVVLAGKQVGVEVSAETIRLETRGETQSAYGEGRRADLLSAGSLFRFWVVRHGPLKLYAAQLGPGVDDEAQRVFADAALHSLTFPEIMPPTAEEFQARVLEIIEREYPAFQATAEGSWAILLSETDGKHRATVGLENLYRSCLLNAESTGAMIRDHLDQLLEERPDVDSYAEYEAVREHLLPMLKSVSWVQEVPEEMRLVTVDFAPGIVMCFVIDEPTRMAYVKQEMLAHWDVPVERIQEVAQDHLAAKGPVELAGLNGPDDKPFALICNMRDAYDAARLCLPAMREQFAQILGDEYLVGLPNRDFLIAFSEKDPEMTANIVRRIKHDYHQMNHAITPTIYRVRQDTIEPTEL